MQKIPYNIPDAILFDLDNTLCTFIDAKLAACRAVVEHLGAGDENELFEYFLRPVHSFEDNHHILDYIDEKKITTPTDTSQITRLFEEVKIAHVTPYPGVHETLSHLSGQGIKMAVVTDASMPQAIRRLHKCNLAQYFQAVVTPDKSGRSKPDPASFILALDELQVSGTIWLVGDSIRREVLPGNQLGFVTVYARYGDYFSCNNPNCSPSYIIDRFPDLLELEGLNSIKKTG